jgi:hypothetical protein
VYSGLKRLYPDLVVFASVQYEHILGLQGDSRALRDALANVYPNVLTNEVVELLKNSDVLALSTYPHMSAGAVISATYYVPAFEAAAQAGRRIAVEQSGFTSENVPIYQNVLLGSESVQNVFIEFLLQQALQQQFVFVVNFLTVDYGTHFGVDALSMAWAYTGLWRPDGTPKPAAQTWDAFAGLTWLPSPNTAPAVAPIVLDTTDHRVAAVVGVDQQRHPYYAMWMSGQRALEPSRIGISVDGIDLGNAVTTIMASEPTAFVESYETRGVHPTAVSSGNQFQVTLVRAGAGDERLQIVFRLCDDGVAYRYVIPGSGTRTISGESSQWTLPVGARVWYNPSTTNYEAPYSSGSIDDLTATFGAPVTAQLPDGSGFAMLTEAELRDYSGMTFRATAGSRTIHAEFLDDTSWEVAGGSMTPWRVVIVAATLNDLVNSDLVANLNEPRILRCFPTALARRGSSLDALCGRGGPISPAPPASTRSWRSSMPPPA